MDQYNNFIYNIVLSCLQISTRIIVISLKKEWINDTSLFSLCDPRYIKHRFAYARTEEIINKTLETKYGKNLK